MEKDKDKGGKTYSYCMASWREGNKVGNAHLGSCRKMDIEAAKEKTRILKAEASGLSRLG
jgi:hypothetical protein